MFQNVIFPFPRGKKKKLLSKVLCLGRGVSLGRDQAPVHTGLCPFPSLSGSAPSCPHKQNTLSCSFQVRELARVENGRENCCPVVICSVHFREVVFRVSTQPGQPFFRPPGGSAAQRGLCWWVGKGKLEQREAGSGGHPGAH